MPDKQTTPAEAAEKSARLDHTIIDLLLVEEARGPWAVEEIAREVGEDPRDSLDRLYGTGLVHRLDSYVWAWRLASRVARRSPASSRRDPRPRPPLPGSAGTGWQASCADARSCTP
jgi:hypothetical protein